MKGNFKMIFFMDKDKWNGQMDESMLVSFRKVLSMGKESTEKDQTSRQRLVDGNVEN